MTIAQRRYTLAALAALTVAWVLADTSFGAGAFEISKYVKSGYTVIYGLASSVVGYLNSWWGMAMAVAALAAFGLSWTAVLIKAVLQKVGFRFAVQYAVML